MMKGYFLFILILLTGISKGQLIHTDTLLIKEFDKAIMNRSLYSDSLVSSFVIAIKDEVKPHKHIGHTEQVFVLSGEGMMNMSGKTFEVKEGDMIVIPKGMVHSLKVTKSPMRVISVQAPFFDGKDRIIIE
jgi:mannose-6-phosphate isomerase-like protein (cupin superfamily)